VLNDLPIVILGAGAHATVLVDLLLSLKRKIVGIVALEESKIKNYPQIAYLGNDNAVSHYHPKEIRLVNGIGTISVKATQKRKKIFDYFQSKEYVFETIVHPSAVLARTVILGEGVQIMAGGILQPNVVVGDNVIINTRASIDHDCMIGSHAHIAPGVVLSGNVSIGENAHIGVGATLIQGVTVGENIMIRAGTVVTKNLLSFEEK